MDPLHMKVLPRGECREVIKKGHIKTMKNSNLRCILIPIS